MPNKRSAQNQGLHYVTNNYIMTSNAHVPIENSFGIIQMDLYYRK
jgi:hypothetical protein